MERLGILKDIKTITRYIIKEVKYKETKIFTGIHLRLGQ